MQHDIKFYFYFTRNRNVTITNFLIALQLKHVGIPIQYISKVRVCLALYFII